MTQMEIKKSEEEKAVNQLLAFWRGRNLKPYAISVHLGSVTIEEESRGEDTTNVKEMIDFIEAIYQEWEKNHINGYHASVMIRYLGERNIGFKEVDISLPLLF